MKSGLDHVRKMGGSLYIISIIGNHPFCGHLVQLNGRNGYVVEIVSTVVRENSLGDTVEWSKPIVLSGRM